MREKQSSPEPDVPAVRLRNGVAMPQLGFGVFLAGSGKGTEQAVRWALEAGYRHIDTAEVYGNEAEVGRAVAASGLPREELFLTGKVWNSHIRAGAAREAFSGRWTISERTTSTSTFSTGPSKGRRRAWNILEELYAGGRIRAIGVSNFQRTPYRSHAAVCAFLRWSTRSNPIH